MNYVQAAHAGLGCVCTPLLACIPTGETALPFLCAGPWTRYSPLSGCLPEVCSVLGPEPRGRMGSTHKEVLLLSSPLLFRRLGPTGPTGDSGLCPWVGEGEGSGWGPWAERHSYPPLPLPRGYQEMSVKVALISGVDATLFLGARCPLWGQPAACRRVLGQSHSACEEAQGERSGLCPASLPSAF